MLSLTDSPADVIAISVAAGAALRQELHGCRLVEAPMMRGLTVWDAVSASRCVGEYPNALGRLDSAPVSMKSVAVVTEPGAPVPAAWELRYRSGARGWVTATDPSPDDVADFGQRLLTARHLAASARQIAGIAVPNGRPESPGFVLAVGSDPGVVVRRTESFLPAAVAIRPGVAAIAGPGCVILEVRHPMAKQEVAAVATVLKRAIERDS